MEVRVNRPVMVMGLSKKNKMNEEVSEDVNYEWWNCERTCKFATGLSLPSNRKAISHT